eukprot:c41501_g1_i1 orf=2-193(-)
MDRTCTLDEFKCHNTPQRKSNKMKSSKDSRKTGTREFKRRNKDEDGVPERAWSKEWGTCKFHLV